jgi:eukaryotic-like serine/threonine-protein kinase
VADPRDPVDPGDETIVRDEWNDETMVVEDEVVERLRRQPLLWPWLLAFLLLVLGGLGAYYYFSQDDDQSTVPAVVGQRQDSAEAEVREAGLEPRSERRPDEQPSGVVLAQDPEEGTELEEGETVRLTVSGGPAERESVEVPDVVGTTSSEATATLRDAELDANIVSVPSARPAGTVIAQSPAAGESVEAGTSVRLNVAEAPVATTTQETTTTQDTTTTPATTAPPESATVPDVVGAELADGARDFGDEGLKVAVRYVPSSEAQGRIVAQARPAGTELRQGDTVQVNVSTGADPAPATEVPRVMGAEQERARSLLEDDGFEVLAIELATADESRVGRVLSQSPGGGASVPQGSLVLLYVGAA